MTDNSISSGKHVIGNGFTFQHDNDHKHTANGVKGYMDRKKTVLEWPPSCVVSFRQ